MRYILIEFTSGLAGEAYQEIDENGAVVRYCSLSGETIELPEATESRVVDDNPPTPSFVEA